MNEAGLLIGFDHFIAQADSITRFILLILLAMSVMTWYVSLVKVWRNLIRRRRSRRFLGDFRQQGGDIEFDDSEPFSRVAVSAMRTWRRYREHQAPVAEPVTQALRRAMNHETTRSESGLTLLASVAASAPFVGLFGTVWGIYHALTAIGASGHAGLQQVAGPVGEALIMTAIGLSVAIPAVLAYNAFQRGNRLLLSELDGFAHELHERLTCGPSPLPEAVGERC